MLINTETLPLVTPRLIDSRVTELVVRTAIGDEIFDVQKRVDPAVFTHGLETGELNAMALEMADCSPETVYLGRLTGGLHDFGKTLMPFPILEFAASGIKFIRPFKRWYTNEHARIGGYALFGMAEETGNTDLEVAAYVAAGHHGHRVDYARRLSPAEAQSEGLLHLTQISDPLHAIALDWSPNRGYQGKQQGGRRRTAKESQQIVMSEWEKNCPGNPVIDGHTVDAEKFIIAAIDRYYPS